MFLIMDSYDLRGISEKLMALFCRKQILLQICAILQKKIPFIHTWPKEGMTPPPLAIVVLLWSPLLA